MPRLQRGGEVLEPLAGRALWWPARGTLLVADVHIGKAASFRRLGVPVPQGTTSETLGRLSALIEAQGAARLVCLGDFIHSAQGRAPATMLALADWRARHPELELLLVRGNHDDRAGDPPAALGFQVVDEPWREDGLALCHEPQAVAGAYVLAGHLHPCVHVGRGFDRLRLPCFHFGAGCGVLPAFGAFTGMHPIRRRAGDVVMAVAEEAVVPV